MAVPTFPLPKQTPPRPAAETTFVTNSSFSSSGLTEKTLFPEFKKPPEQPKILQILNDLLPPVVNFQESCPCEEARPVSPEMQHVRAVMKMLELQDQIHETDLEIQKLILLKAAGTDTHPQVIEERCRKINSIAQHLQLIVQKTEAVQMHLQQPTSVDYLPLNFQHHKSFKNITSMIHNMLEQGDEVVSNVEWSYSVKDTNVVDQLLSDVQQKIMEYHSSASKLQIFHDCVTKYCEQHAE